MTLNRLPSTLFIISTLSSVALLGCQSSTLKKPEQTSAVIEDKNGSDSTLSPRLFQTSIAHTIKSIDDNPIDINAINIIPQHKLLQTLSNYEWQLSQIKDTNNLIESFDHQSTLIMQVVPNRLLFKEDCRSYDVYFDETYQQPYAYQFSSFSKDVYNHCTNTRKSNIKAKLKSLLDSYDTNYRFDLLSGSSQTAKLALNMENGVTLIFTGRVEPTQKIVGLPITNNLLERYRWRLVKATDKDNHTIKGFNQADVPIIGHFTTDQYRRSVGYHVGCNGAGGPYALTTNRTLFIGIAFSTMVSCGKRIDDIESDFNQLLSDSRSQLVLIAIHEAADKASEINDKSLYQLTQKLDSGETLVWENEIKETP